MFLLNTHALISLVLIEQKWLCQVIGCGGKFATQISSESEWKWTQFCFYFRELFLQQTFFQCWYREVAKQVWRASGKQIRLAWSRTWKRGTVCVCMQEKTLSYKLVWLFSIYNYDGCSNNVTTILCYVVVVFTISDYRWS